MEKSEFTKAIMYLKSAAEKDFNESMERLQKDAKGSFTWVAETLISSAYKKDVYGRILLDLEKRSPDEILTYFINQLGKQPHIRKSSNQFDLLESVIQMETAQTILNELSWTIK